jgi:hypothetical protein
MRRDDDRKATLMTRGFLFAALVGLLLAGIVVAFYLWIHTSSW